MAFIIHSTQPIVPPVLVHEWYRLISSEENYQREKELINWCSHELLVVEFHDHFVEGAVRICIEKHYQRRIPKTRPVPTKQGTRFRVKHYVETMRWSRRLRAWHSVDGHWFFPVWMTIKEVK